MLALQGVSLTPFSCSVQIPWGDATAIKREIKKFKDIFSKSIYNELLGKIGNTNGALKTLLEQSHHREETRKRRRISKRPLLKYKSARKHATSLYNAIIRGKCWKCPCKDQHCVHLRIEPQPLGGGDVLDSHPVLPRFQMAFSSKTTRGLAKPLWHWQEVETVPVIVRQHVPAKSTSVLNTVSSAPSNQKVQFAIVTSTPENLPWPEVQDPSPYLPISDMCSALCTVNGDHECRELIGSILDESDASHRYDMYLVRNLASDLQTQSLEDLLASSFNPLGLHMARGGFVFKRRDRLFLAATLACSLLQFHGSWLKTQWGSRDILFAKTEDGNKAMLNHPYLSWHVLGKPEELNVSTQVNRATTALIRSEILFPLGLALVELSLCQTLSALRIPEDSDPIDAVANLKTASRLLHECVYFESGARYGDAVDKCLFWSETRNTKFDDEEFQRTVFDTIVSPLLDDLRDFEGKSRIH